MLITSASLDALRVGFRNDFNAGIGGYKPLWDKIAMRVPSSTAANVYGWLRDMPRLREWLGDRVVNSIAEGDYTIRNRKFEETIGIGRDAIEDDTFGIYSPMMRRMGESAAEFPDELVFALLAAGGITPCWDGQNFFDQDHPVGAGVVSNVQAGVEPAWYLMDTSKSVKPLIYQERKAPNFVAMTREEDEHVFLRSEYRYGVDMRCNAGFGFWQLAFASQAPLTAANYAALRLAMTSQRNDYGRPMNIKPNAIVVGPTNRAAAKQLFDTMLLIGGGNNIYYQDVEIIESPWLS